MTCQVPSPHCDAIIHRSVPQACPAPADHQGFYNLPRDQTARDGTRHRSKESQRNLCSFGLNTFYKLNKLRGRAAGCGYCALSIVRWPGPGRWQDFLQLCRFICSGLLTAGFGAAGSVSHYPNIESISFVAHLVFFPTLRTDRG